MKYFVAKVDSRVGCERCGEKMLKGSHRANKRIVIKESGVIYAYTIYLHKECYLKERSKW